MRILLVDDEIVALHALKKRVDWVKYGFTEVLTAQDATSAKELLKKYSFNLLISDIEMPGGSGLSLVEYVTAEYPATKCIFVTCHADFDYAKQAMKYGALDYILKPIDYSELENLLIKFTEDQNNSRKKAELERIVEKTQEAKGIDAMSGEDRLEMVKKYIEDHIQDQIHVDDLAKLVHINSQHLMRTFRRETGQSILEYITERRILLASNLLKETNHSINFIANCIGCDNYSYFTKLFKRYSGYTPSEYRAQYKEEQ